MEKDLLGRPVLQGGASGPQKWMFDPSEFPRVRDCEGQLKLFGRKTMKTSQKKNQLKKFVIIGTGLQAPYGIGEFIADTNSIKKAKKIAAGWYNQPAVITREEYLSQKAKARI